MTGYYFVLLLLSVISLGISICVSLAYFSLADRVEELDDGQQEIFGHLGRLLEKENDR